MKTSQYLLALPIVWLASLSAAACGSSNSGTGTLDGGSSASECAALNICCTAMGVTAPAYAGCLATVSAGGADCASTLTTLTAEGACKAPGSSSSQNNSSALNSSSHPATSSQGGSSSPGASSSSPGGGSSSQTVGSSQSGSSVQSGSSNPSSSQSGSHQSSTEESSSTMTGSNPSSSASASSSSHASSSRSSSSVHHSSSSVEASSTASSTTTTAAASSSISAPPATCANPPGSITGFVAPTGVIGTGCSKTEVQTYGTCEVSAPSSGDPNCEDALVEGVPDGDLNTCGACVYATQIHPDQNPPATWGMNLLVAIEPTLGDTTNVWYQNYGPEIGVCVYQAAGSAGHACGIDLMSLDACTYAVCSSVCPIPNPGTGTVNQTAQTAYNTCVSTVQGTGACASYLTAARTDCNVSTAVTNVTNQCVTLYNQYVSNTFGYDYAPEAGAATATGVEQLLELACGGGDAGF